MNKNIKEKEEYQRNRSNGITLIALVVTIIILLILAGVALTAMINGGIFDKAKEAAEQTQIGKEKEQIATSYSKYKMEKAQGIETTLTIDGASVTGNDTDGWTITFEDTGNTYKIHPDGKVEETGKVEKEPLAEPTDIYVTLYADGTLGFSNNEEKIAGKEESRSYGNIKGQYFEYVSNVPWYENKESITTVEIQNEIVPTETACWFYNCSNLTQINNISNLNTSLVKTMSSMFSGCSSLQEIDLKNFKTNNVTNMYSMFYECSNMQKLDLSSFETGNVTNMMSMFCDCSSLTELIISNFDTGNVIDMSSMFLNCSSLTKLDIKKFKTNNVTSMEAMFWNCSNLTELIITNFDTSNVTKMGVMFSGCSSLKELDVSHFNTKNVTDMRAMFSQCSSLTELIITNFDTSKVTNIDGMFAGCSKLTELNLSNFDTSSVTNMYQLFWCCDNLTKLDLSRFNTSSVTDMGAMFYCCTNLKLVYGRKDRWITANVTDSSNMWYNCGANHITYKTYLENNKVVGYEIRRGFNWYANSNTNNVAKKGTHQRRAYTLDFIQLDPEKTYKLKMNNTNYYADYIPLDIDYNMVGSNAKTSATNTELTITGYGYIVVTFGPIPDNVNLTDEMLAEIEEAFSITVVE